MSIRHSVDVEKNASQPLHLQKRIPQVMTKEPRSMLGIFMDIKTFNKIVGHQAFSMIISTWGAPSGRGRAVRSTLLQVLEGILCVEHDDEHDEKVDVLTTSENRQGASKSI